MRMARLLGWYIEVVDQRTERDAHFGDEGADRVHAISPEMLPILLAERHFDAAIVGGQDFDLDMRHLRHLGASGIGYVGLLGPPERRDALLGRLGDIIATQLEPRLYAPVGLRLGGEGPEARALAIVAQMQYYLAHDVHA
jgi:xanthine dehydrogenase accessory factor